VVNVFLEIGLKELREGQMRKWLGAAVVLACALAVVPDASALSINTSSNATTLSDAIVNSAGAGITITSVSYSGHAEASGTFTSGPLGIGDGTLITNGQAQLAMPPSNSGSTGYNQYRSGNAMCDTLISSDYTTYDANWLKITFNLAPGTTAFRSSSFSARTSIPSGWVPPTTTYSART